MNYVPKIDRRSFLVGTAAVGGGLSLGLQTPVRSRRRARSGRHARGQCLGGDPPGRHRRHSHCPLRDGSGLAHGLAQLVAEELECDWSKVTTEYPTPGQNTARKRVWGDYATVGSRAIRQSHQYVRQGGAAAREMLKQAAANEWKVPVSEVTAANSVITHTPSGRTTTYGKVAEAAAKLEPPKEVPLKNPKDWKIAGKPIKRLDTADKLTGKQIYSMDVKQPGMLNAAIKESPVFGGKVKSFDAAKIEKMPGVKKVLQVGDAAVAVVADTWWNAKTALEALPIVWDDGPNAKVSSASIAEMLKAGLDAPEAFVGNQQGDAKAAIAGAAKKVEAVYAYPFQNHAAMEPMNATALYTPDKCEVWTSTQNGEAALAAAREASGLPIEKCDVHNTILGGGFGRRARSEYVSHAVRIAKEMPGTPIKLIKSREDDTANGVYHPITQCKLTGAFDANNNLTGLHMRISGQSILAAVNPAGLQNGRDPATFQGLNAGGTEGAFGYTIPNLLIDHAMRNTHIPPWFWRGVNNNQNAIYLECFMDELAHAAGQDPLEFRRKLMTQASQASRRAQRGGREGRLGKTCAARRSSRPRPAHGLRQLRRRGGGNLRDGRQQDQDPPHRGRHRLRPCGQSRPDRAADRWLLRLRAVGRVLRRVHREGRPHRADQLPRLQFDADRRDAEGRGDRDAVRTTSGAASASRPSSWQRLPCSTPSSRRPASASARSR